MSGKENPPFSIMARRFLNTRPLPDRDSSPPTFRKQFYFFYGTLMDPKTLAKVLNLQEQPVLLPTKIIGYHCMLWGPHPALLDGPGGAVVHGMAYEVQSPSEVKLIEDYETDHYEKGDLEEGVFDPKDWWMKNLERGLEAKPPAQ